MQQRAATVPFSLVPDGKYVRLPEHYIAGVKLAEVGGTNFVVIESDSEDYRLGHLFLAGPNDHAVVQGRVEVKWLDWSDQGPTGLALGDLVYLGGPVGMRVAEYGHEHKVRDGVYLTTGERFRMAEADAPAGVL